MLRIPVTQRFLRKRGLLLSGVLLLVSTQSLAQSGRKTKPQTPNNVPLISDDSAPQNASTARDLKHKVTLLVGRRPAEKHTLSEDAIFVNFVKRLNELKNVYAIPLGDIKQDALVKRAKTESEAICVFVQFDVDTFQNGTIFLDSPDLDVHVSVFAPVNGQQKFKGKVYYKALSGPNLKKDNWPNGTPIRITTEAVGIEAAEQVRDWLILEDVKKKD